MSASLVHRTLQINGISMYVAEQGSGPLVILCHGWPELWYAWRHQLPVLAGAGYRAVAPDMRGFGRTEAPEDKDAYSLLHGAGDMVALVAALEETEAVIFGHDWGASVAWCAALLRPDIFRAVVGMSVPYRPRGPVPPLQALHKMGLEDFYWIYFQTEGVAEREFERDVEHTMRCLLYSGSGDFSGEPKSLLLVPRGGGFLDNCIDPQVLPAWLTERDISVITAEYERSGFRGSLNWFRNIDRNWELLAAWEGARIEVPALFIAGNRDLVIAGERGVKALEQMAYAIPGMKRSIIEGAGHWVHEERPAQVNAALMEFLTELKAA